MPLLNPITPKPMASVVEPLKENFKAGAALDTPTMAAAVMMTCAGGGTFSAKDFIRPPTSFC